MAVHEIYSMAKGDDLIVNGTIETFEIIVRKLAAGTQTLKRGALVDRADADGKYIIHNAASNSGKAEFNGDGSEKSFTISDKPEILDSVKVGTTEVTAYTYVQSTGVITFTTAPAAGTKNVVIEYTIENTVADAILAADCELGTAADTAVLAYRKGTFNKNVVGKRTLDSNMSALDLGVLRDYTISYGTSANTYTSGDDSAIITAADEIALRSVGIYLVDAQDIVHVNTNA